MVNSVKTRKGSSARDYYFELVEQIHSLDRAMPVGSWYPVYYFSK